MTAPHPRRGAGSRAPHPCDGVWLETGPFAELGVSSPSRMRAWSAAAAAGVTGLVAPLEADGSAPLGLEPAALHDVDLAVRIDVESVEDLHAALRLEPELVGLPASALASPHGARGVARDVEASESSLVLLLDGPGHDDPGLEGQGAARVRGLADALGDSLLGISLRRFDETVLEGLLDMDTLALHVPGVSFASGFRLGATAIDSTLGLLGPGAATRMFGLCETDLPGALVLERRLQHALESAVAPLVRRWIESPAPGLDPGTDPAALLLVRAEIHGIDPRALIAELHGGPHPELEAALTHARDSLLGTCPELGQG